MTALVDSPVVVWLVPVKGGDAVVHLVRRDERDFSPKAGAPSLCGYRGRFDARFVRYSWTRVRKPARTHCVACWAAGCKKPTRIDWS
jgi:hypothetical protein